MSGKPPRVWVDADACPGAVREILFRAAQKGRARVILVANQQVRAPASENVESVQVSKSFDAADKHIIDACAPGEIVVTADVPLAAEIVRRGAHALSPRGELFTEENAGERLATRDLMEELRSGGLTTGGPPPFGPRDRESFANQLDKLLSKVKNSRDESPRARR